MSLRYLFCCFDNVTTAGTFRLPKKKSKLTFRQIRYRVKLNCTLATMTLERAIKSRLHIFHFTVVGISDQPRNIVWRWKTRAPIKRTSKFIRVGFFFASQHSLTLNSFDFHSRKSDVRREKDYSKSIINKLYGNVFDIWYMEIYIMWLVNLWFSCVVFCGFFIISSRLRRVFSRSRWRYVKYLAKWNFMASQSSSQKVFPSILHRL